MESSGRRRRVRVQATERKPDGDEQLEQAESSEDLQHRAEGGHRLERLKLLSHHYKITTRVEIFVGSCGLSQMAAAHVVSPGSKSKQQPEWLGANFRRVGHVSFSPNSHTAFKARELKTVHLDSIEGQFLKLVFHKV